MSRRISLLARRFLPMAVATALCMTLIMPCASASNQSEIDALIDKITGFGVQVSPVIGTELSILGLVGDTSKIDPTQIEANRNVDKVLHVAEPFKKANKMFHPMPTVVDVGGVKVGGKQLAIIAGPCSVET